MKLQFAAGILIGGVSQRMGFPKTQLRHRNGKTLLESKVEQLSTLTSEIILATAPHFKVPSFPFPIKLGIDQNPYTGPLEGLCTLLRHTEYPYLFLTACDMPLLNLALVQELLKWASKVQKPVVPVTAQGPIYLFSMYPTVFKEPIFQVRQTQQALKSLANVLDFHWLEEKEWARWDPRAAFAQNLNTPEEYQKFREGERAEHPAS